MRDTTTKDRAGARIADACTLPTVELPSRLAEFDELFATALRGVQRVERVRLRLTLDPAASVEETARDLAARESACCSFFTFTLTRAPGCLLLDIAVPAEYAQVLDGLTERAARSRRTAR